MALTLSDMKAQDQNEQEKARRQQSADKAVIAWLTLRRPLKNSSSCGGHMIVVTHLQQKHHLQWSIVAHAKSRSQ